LGFTALTNPEGGGGETPIKKGGGGRWFILGVKKEGLTPLRLLSLKSRNFRGTFSHTDNDVHLIPIETIFSNRDLMRKAREALLMQKGRTIDPDGVNIREETF